ncbi:MAG: cobalamin biosynthesis protein [Giesbergeria sp.]|nr:cobalamin biosynthesis protein [Giesbergeria sp.]
MAGFGFRAAATLESLRSALHMASNGSVIAITALATAADKANHPALMALARELTLPLMAVPLAQLTESSAAAVLAAHSRIPERYGARSLAESSALAAAGQGAHLLAPRAVSADKMATAAIASITLHKFHPR